MNKISQAFPIVKRMNEHMPSVCLKENRILHYSVWILMERILYLHSPCPSSLQGPFLLKIQPVSAISR